MSAACEIHKVQILQIIYLDNVNGKAALNLRRSIHHQDASTGRQEVIAPCGQPVGEIYGEDAEQFEVY